MSLAGITKYSQSLLINSINRNFSGMFTSMERLSSGLRINRASDGPADLVISEQLRSRIASLQQEIENSLGQVSRYNTGQSAVMELRDHLTQLRSIAVSAANEGFNSKDAQDALNAEAQAIVGSFNDLKANAEFNGNKLLDGSEQALANISDLSSIDMSSASTAEDSVGVIDQAISQVDSVLVDIGSTQKYQLEAGIRSMEITKENLTAAESMIRDADLVTEYTNHLVSMFKMKVGLAMLAHSSLTADTTLSLFD